MAEAQLDNYLKKAIKQGYSEKDIKKGLVRSGWNKGFVNDYCKTFFEEHGTESKRFSRGMSFVRSTFKKKEEPEKEKRTYSRKTTAKEKTEAKPAVKKQTAAKKKTSSKQTNLFSDAKDTLDDSILKGPKTLLKTYNIDSGGIPVTIGIYNKPGEFVPFYTVQLSSISKTTRLILEKIRQELINKVNLGMVDITDSKKSDYIENKFSEAIQVLIQKYFPGLEEENEKFLTSYLVKKSLGMGDIELLMSDPELEEIAINSTSEPVWVYHKEFGWLKTNIILQDEAQSKHYATMIGRKVNRQITVLEPLMDATLGTGDRVNATLSPISTRGNTITIRKFAAKPWTISDFIKIKAISAEAAALVWECVHYEMSALIAGGTASGKTSMLNVVSNFFPPNQRIISIEDTREVQLPKFIHWVPMLTRLPNNEGRGGISMLDLLVNSLRMRPDRIVVGEIRRKQEAEVLFESIHTGHSVYATVHANNTKETITRLTSPPLEIPKSMLPAISLILVQYRNRRTGLRRTFELSEIKESGEPNILMRYDVKKDVLNNISDSVAIKDTLSLYTGATQNSIKQELKEKTDVLKWLVKQKVSTVNSVGRVMAEYYTNKDNLMKFVKKNKPFKV